MGEPLNDESLMTFKLSYIVTVLSFLQDAKAFGSTVSIEDVICTSSKTLLFLKALEAIPFTVLPLISRGIYTTLSLPLYEVIYNPPSLCTVLKLEGLVSLAHTQYKY